MSIVRVGTNQKYASGWDRAFGKTTKKKADKPAAKKASPKAAKGAKAKKGKK